CLDQFDHRTPNEIVFSVRFESRHKQSVGCQLFVIWGLAICAAPAFRFAGDVVARIDIVELHTSPSGETIKIRAAIPLYVSSQYNLAGRLALPLALRID